MRLEKCGWLDCRCVGSLYRNGWSGFNGSWNRAGQKRRILNAWNGSSVQSFLLVSRLFLRARKLVKIRRGRVARVEKRRWWREARGEKEDLSSVSGRWCTMRKERARRCYFHALTSAKIMATDGHLRPLGRRWRATVKWRRRTRCDHTSNRMDFIILI